MVKDNEIFVLLSVYLGYLFASNAKFWTVFIRLKRFSRFKWYVKMHYVRCTAKMHDGEWVKLCRNISLQHFSWNIYLICESDISEKNLVIITSSGGWNNLQDGNVQNLFHLYYCIYSIHVERQHIDTATATYKKHASVLNFRFNKSSFYNKDDTSHFSNF